jgi:hypothetical protein
VFSARRTRPGILDEGREGQRLDEKIDGLVTQQAEMAGDVKDIKKIQSAQTTDIAVIKRQLGLDGLGPPPTRASGIGR